MAVLFHLLLSLFCPSTARHLPPSSFADKELNWYVSALHGNDSWSGNQSHPVRSLQKVQALVRSRADRSRPGIVHVASGRYEQTSTLEFGPADGGESASAAIRWEGPTNASEPAVISFGRLVQGGSWVRLNKTGPLWQLQLDVGGGVPRQTFDAASGLRMMQVFAIAFYARYAHSSQASRTQIKLRCMWQ
jgi:hypothetical protein